jgi:hypothetical protein
MQRSLEVDELWRGTCMMDLPQPSASLSQMAESPEDLLERRALDPAIVSLILLI